MSWYIVLITVAYKSKAPSGSYNDHPYNVSNPSLYRLNQLLFGYANILRHVQYNRKWRL